MTYLLFQFAVVLAFAVGGLVLLRAQRDGAYPQAHPGLGKGWVLLLAALCFVCFAYRLFGATVWRYLVTKGDSSLLQIPAAPPWLGLVLVLLPLAVLTLTGILLLWKGRGIPKTGTTVALHRACGVSGLLCLVLSVVWVVVEIAPVMQFYLAL